MTRRIQTQVNKLKKKQSEIHSMLIDIERNREVEIQNLDKAVKRHKINFNELRSCDADVLTKIYKYLDKTFYFDFEGGLRCDTRGMALTFWVDDDPNFLCLHIYSTCENICFSGSTSYIAKAKTTADKIAVLKQVYKTVKQIIEEK